MADAIAPFTSRRCRTATTTEAVPVSIGKHIAAAQDVRMACRCRCHSAPLVPPIAESPCRRRGPATRPAT
eukprot:14029989-Heterocapsa_arctica.AAC.1